MSRRILFLSMIPLSVASIAGVGCLSEGGLAPTSTAADGSTGGANTVITTPDSSIAVIAPDAAVDDPTTNDAIKDSKQPFLTYRDDLTQHPGCSQAGLSGVNHTDGLSEHLPTYIAATLPGYPCAAREVLPSGTEDTTKPIVILVHGNSSSPYDWENVPSIDKDTATPPATTQLAPSLAAAGYHVFEADLRVDLVPVDGNNAAKNVDHGWAVPIVQALIKAVHAQYPTRKINMSGFSLGPTIIRDALRRLHHNGDKPFAYVHALHLVSGSNHGVSTFAAYCTDINNPTKQNMVGWAACQLGNRVGYTPVPFLDTLNGPNGAYETPCADGIHAYGQTNVCGANIVLYTTAVHADQPDGTTKDEFVSQASAMLLGAQNLTVAALQTDKWFGGYFPNHYGAIRTTEAVSLATQALER